MEFLPIVVVSFSAFLSLYTCGAQEISSTASYGIEDSLKVLKTEWESIFNSKYELLSITDLQLSINDSCGKLFSDSVLGCQEILQGEGRALLVSVEDGRYYHEDFVSLR